MGNLMVLGRVCDWALLAWMQVGFFIWLDNKSGGRLLKPKIREFLRFIFHEIKPFYWVPLVAVDAIWTFTDPSFSTFTRAFWLFVVVANWFTLKDIDKDDRWKKRKEKLLGTVKSLGHRLVVVNEAAT